MLDDARTIHTIYIRQSNRLLPSLVDPDVGKSDIIVKTRPKDRRGYERNDLCEFLFVGDASLGIKRIMLGEIDGDVGVKGVYDILLHVELVDECQEDLSLSALWCWMTGAVGFRATGLGGAGLVVLRNVGECE